MTDTLNELLVRMRVCAGSDDTEGAHYDADGLLVEVIRWLAAATEREDVIRPCEEIVVVYDEVTKWYA